MATLKEKENLIEAFKGPFFYRVRLWGYGASVIVTISAGFRLFKISR